MLPDGRLKVHSIFHTIQGEGPLAGRPAVFVRLSGCNLQCPGCDTEYTTGHFFSSSDLMRTVEKAADGTRTSLIVLTGGEPFRQDFSKFSMEMVYKGWQVQVETNGTLWFDNFFPSRYTLVVSPKAPKINQNLRPYVKHLKYVLDAEHVDENDGLPTSVLGNGLRPARPWTDYGGTVWLQPADAYEEEDETIREAKNAANRAAVIQSCLRFGYRYCPQIHKEANLP